MEFNLKVKIGKPLVPPNRKTIKFWHDDIMKTTWKRHGNDMETPSNQHTNEPSACGFNKSQPKDSQFFYSRK